MACYVYILGSARASGYQTYIGWTVDLDQRLERDDEGAGAKSTRGRFWVLLYAERYDDRRDAMSREWHLKRDKQFRAMMRGL